MQVGHIKNDPTNNAHIKNSCTKVATSLKVFHMKLLVGFTTASIMLRSTLFSHTFTHWDHCPTDQHAPSTMKSSDTSPTHSIIVNNYKSLLRAFCSCIIEKQCTGT